jgi:hypothetical protein
MKRICWMNPKMGSTLKGITTLEPSNLAVTFVYWCILVYILIYIFICIIDLLIKFSLGWQMSTESPFTWDSWTMRVNHIWNMASAAWVIYSTEVQLVSSGGVRLEPSTNNVVEYSIIIDSLLDAI